MKFKSFDLDPGILDSIREMGYEKCMPVQEQALPESLAGRDVSVQAQTGTGKTAVFLITVLQGLVAKGDAGGKTKALILVPTRELAVQVEQQAEILCKNLPYRSVSIYGGVGYDQQERMLKSGVELIVATPGRLIDYVKSKKLDLSHLSYFIIDEADRMFDMGFMPDVRYILKKVPAKGKRQTMIFSATLDTRVRSLASSYMNDPVVVEIEPDQITVENVKQKVYHVSREEKIRLLLALLTKEPTGKAIIFTNMKRTAEQVGFKLSGNGLDVEVLTGDVNQSKRLRIIEKIKAHKLDCLVATDVAARGLHIDGVTHVINYDVPTDAANYVHRIGRTARAGEHGIAITIACEELVEYLPTIERFIEHKIEVGRIDFDLPEDNAGPYRRPRRPVESSGRTARHAKPERPRGRPTSKETSFPERDHKKSDKPGRSYKKTETVARPKKRKPSPRPGKKMSRTERLAYYKEKYGDSFDSTKVGGKTGVEKKKDSKKSTKISTATSTAKSTTPKKRGLISKILGRFKKKK